MEDKQVKFWTSLAGQFQHLQLSKVNSKVKNKLNVVYFEVHS